jgi:hypothetical protein
MNDRPETATNDELPTRRKYEKPRLIEYGHVAKLTQSGGMSTKDFGNMMRP